MSHDERPCACGRAAIEVMPIATEDGLLLVPACADCIEAGDVAGAEQGDLWGRPQRRPLKSMRAREDDQQPPLPLGDASDIDEQQGAA